MKKRILTFALLVVIGVTYAQKPVKKGLQSINRETAEAHIAFLADDNLDGRKAGTKGGEISALYIASVLKSMGVKAYNGNYFQAFDICRKGIHGRGRWQVHLDSIAKLKKEDKRCLHLNNVLGMIPGKRADEYVVVGAHFDHLGVDTLLTGDQIYNGADDNASGVSAVLQIAHAFIKSRKQPERNVIFAFWDGEEIGLLGSQYFVQTCSFLKQIKGYLNFDMIGRNNESENPQNVVYFYTAANVAFGQWLKEDIKEYRLKLDPVYKSWDRPVEGSDNASFALHDIPIIWYHTGGHPDFHKPTDHVEHINWEKVVEISKASFLNVWNLANEEVY